ncbi:MAG: hypothetical protein FK732_00055 [Asgard group archaeon]|nr:hypothetical protein [Asgard group archaeon]
MPGFQRGARVRLVELAEKSIELLKKSGDVGIRSDVLAAELETPKRRVYDVIAVLKAVELVKTQRRFDGTIVTWIDKSKDYVPIDTYTEVKSALKEENESRKELQVQVAELKEQLRMTKTKLRKEVHSIETANKTEFNTTQLRIRSLSCNGFKKVSDSGMEVIVETHEPGIIVDPTEKPTDEKDTLIRNLQRT